MSDLPASYARASTSGWGAVLTEALVRVSGERAAEALKDPAATVA